MKLNFIDGKNKEHARTLTVPHHLVGHSKDLGVKCAIKSAICGLFGMSVKDLPDSRIFIDPPDNLQLQQRQRDTVVYNTLPSRAQPWERSRYLPANCFNKQQISSMNRAPTSAAFNSDAPQRRSNNGNSGQHDTPPVVGSSTINVQSSLQRQYARVLDRRAKVRAQVEAQGGGVSLRARSSSPPRRRNMARVGTAAAANMMWRHTCSQPRPEVGFDTSVRAVDEASGVLNLRPKAGMRGEQKARSRATAMQQHLLKLMSTQCDAVPPPRKGLFDNYGKTRVEGPKKFKKQVISRRSAPLSSFPAVGKAGDDGVLLETPSASSNDDIIADGTAEEETLGSSKTQKQKKHKKRVNVTFAAPPPE